MNKGKKRGGLSTIPTRRRGLGRRRSGGLGALPGPFRRFSKLFRCALSVSADPERLPGVRGNSESHRPRRKGEDAITGGAREQIGARGGPPAERGASHEHDGFEPWKGHQSLV